MNGTLQLSLSQVEPEAELHEGRDIHTFATDWHFHDTWQLVIATKGGRRYQFRDSTFTAKPGELLIIPPRLVHRASCVEDGRTSVKIVFIPKARLGLGPLSAPIALSDTKAVDACLSAYEVLFFENDRQHKDATLSRLQETLTATLLQKPEHKFAFHPHVAKAESQILQRMDEIPSLDTLSSTVGLSRFHLAHTFSKHVGLSPLAFHSRLRLMQARQLLAQGCSLIDTATQLSFADQSHFGRHFKRVYGMTPGQYQQSVTAQRAILY